MYIRVPENRLSLTIVQYVFANSKAIPLVVIVPSLAIIMTWFHENITRHEVIVVSLTRYTNKGICIT
jgi:hypothetical protein